MKTRNGFVSNSSSSSFVLKVGEPFNTTLDVAEFMVPKRKWETDAVLVERIKALRASKENPPAVCFRSCNYDTFIAKMGEYFLIETCHNHDWDLGDFRSSCPPEFFEYFGDDSFYELPRKVDFYHLDYGVTGHQADWRLTQSYDWCQECHNEYWVISGKLMCPKCQTEPKKRK